MGEFILVDYLFIRTIINRMHIISIISLWIMLIIYVIFLKGHTNPRIYIYIYNKRESCISIPAQDQKEL